MIKATTAAAMIAAATAAHAQPEIEWTTIKGWAVPNATDYTPDATEKYEEFDDQHVYLDTVHRPFLEVERDEAWATGRMRALILAWTGDISGYDGQDHLIINVFAGSTEMFSMGEWRGNVTVDIMADEYRGESPYTEGSRNDESDVEDIYIIIRRDQAEEMIQAETVKLRIDTGTVVVLSDDHKAAIAEAMAWATRKHDEIGELQPRASIER
jgi:hypothetical protein